MGRRATARAGSGGPDSVRLTNADLLHGAKLQLRGALRMKARAAALAAPAARTTATQSFLALSHVDKPRSTTC